MVFLFTNSREETISRVREGQDADTPLRGLNHIQGAEHLTVTPKSMRSILFIPRLLRYDFVITQDNLLLGYIVSLYSRIFGAKTRWIYIAMNSSTLMRRHSTHRVRMFLFKKFWASYSRIICLYHEQIEDFVRLGISRDRLVFVPFGVDINFFKPRDTSIEEDLVVSIGRDAGRDYQTLLKSAERTNHKFVVVAGRKNISPDMTVPANVQVLYDKSLVEIRDLYARAKLVVVVSKDESLSDGSDCSGQTVILDALSAGKAVVATRRAWITDYFVLDEDLVVITANDPKALARAIESLLSDSDKRKRVALSGYTKTVERYNTKAFAEALQNVMNSLV